MTVGVGSSKGSAHFLSPWRCWMCSGRCSTRAGTGIVEPRLGHLIWRGFRAASALFGRQRSTILSLCGPVVLLLAVFGWALALTVGTALIIHPVLGSSVTTDGSTPRDFVAALYASGSSMTIVGAGTFAPQTSGFRLFYLFTSLVGMAVLSLVLTYFGQVYAALQRRNALALQIHLASAESGDAAEVIAGLGPRGRFDGGYANPSTRSHWDHYLRELAPAAALRCDEIDPVGTGRGNESHGETASAEPRQHELDSPPPRAA